MNGFEQEYDKLSETKKKEFSRIANKLLSVNYLTRLIEKDRSDYFFIVNYLRLYKKYFAVLDYELQYFEYDELISLVSTQNYNHLQFKKFESVLLLLLRKIYHQKMQQIAQHKGIITSVEELISAIEEVGLTTGRLKKTELKDALALFKRYNICQLNGKIDEEDATITLYPTILYIIPIEKIDAIDKQLKLYLKGEGKLNEEDDKNAVD
ncbi:MAG: DUF4194 domain-containing protein [Culicoidibacterales bacterium]